MSVFMRHVIQGFLDEPSPDVWFDDKASATFILKLIVYGLQTMAGDGILVSPCIYLTGA